ncbi:cytosolic sulfotransferase 16-like [Gossypium australe]|uniref:Cytosolic sulfotransferase 16-like n=1 Tax=Gossypium australe TaxID=47621 RepID=A0A5B6VPQ0_9ROSI|nr:cytosolic sulfotransferase 16-like [Gossypium australe]
MANLNTVDEDLANLNIMDEEKDPMLVVGDDIAVDQEYGLCLTGRVLTNSHRESFCLVRLTLGDQQVKFGWDLSLRVAPRRRGKIVSKWLREESETDKWARMKINGESKERTFGADVTNRSDHREEKGSEGHCLKDLPMEFVDGKKRQRFHTKVGDFANNKGLLKMGMGNEISTAISNFSKSHIDVEEDEGNDMAIWKFTGFYGAPVEHARKDSWELLRRQNPRGKTNGCNGTHGREYQFHFNADWILDNNFEKQVKSGWNSTEQNNLVKLKEMGVSSSNCAKKEKVLREQRTTVLNSRLLELSINEISDAILAEIIEIKLDLNFEADRKELFWEQRARIN